MLEHSYRIVKTGGLAINKYIRWLFIAFSIAMIVLPFTMLGDSSIGNFMKEWYSSLVYLAAGLMILFTLLDWLSIKEIGTLLFSQNNYEARIKGSIQTCEWANIGEVNFSKVHTKVYRLEFDGVTFLLKLTKEELVELENFLESKDLMEEADWPFYFK